MRRLIYPLILALLPGIAAASGLTAERKAELVHLLRQDCGACHGMTLKGGLGKPLLPEYLENKPQETLKATILYGRAGTPMPPWKGLLTEQEADYLARILKKGVPDAR
ncbi:MAG TPA: cytochrome c [Gammaproteobacteria bacterium]|nr:cytochrome c [Gammaproteobacteria bacterium]